MKSKSKKGSAPKQKASLVKKKLEGQLGYRTPSRFSGNKTFSKGTKPTQPRFTPAMFKKTQHKG